MRSPLLVALFHPLNVLMLGLAVLAGLIAAWWLFPLGVIFWGVMVAVIARDPGLRLSHQMQKREPLAPRFQHYFDRIERSQVSVFNSMASAPAGVRRALLPVQSEMDALVIQAYALCRRMTVLENYRLVSQSRADLEADLRQIEARIAATEDVLMRREYEDSRRSLQERMAKFQAVSTQLDRVEAQLMSLTNEMDGVVTQVVRLQAMGAQDAARHVPELVRKLREEATQLREFERAAMRL